MCKKYRIYSIDGGNIECRYAFYGLNRIRCSREGNEGKYCQYGKCKFFKI